MWSVEKLQKKHGVNPKKSYLSSKLVALQYGWSYAIYESDHCLCNL